MCTFEILSPRIDIVDYLVPRWHVSSTSCNLLVFVVKMMLDILAIYQRELFPNTSCLTTIGTHLCVVEIIDHLYIGLCFYWPYLVPRISHSLMYLLMISSKWWFLHLVSFSLGISLSFGIGSWKFWACIFTSCILFGMLSFVDSIYRGNST